MQISIHYTDKAIEACEAAIAAGESIVVNTSRHSHNLFIYVKLYKGTL